MSTLEPNRDQIEIFADALFRHAPEGYVSLRAFHHDNSVFRITPVRLNGKGLRFLCDAAEDDARRAAQSPKPAVFCPPVAVFVREDKAREEDLAAGLALSAELDERPHDALDQLEETIGPATIIVRSGGQWIDADGAAQDKLHAHWRLAVPARGGDLAKLKTARRLAAKLVGGDASSIPAVHPLRWPGSWHRKAYPRLCEIARCDPDREIDLDEALAGLTAASPNEEQTERGNGEANTAGDRADWSELIGNIIAGRDLHASANRLAAAYLASGMDVRGATRAIEALFLTSDCPRDERWKSRFDDIGRAVRSAHEKFGKQEKTGKQDKQESPIDEATTLDTIMNTNFAPIAWVVPGILVEGVTLLAAKPKVGKSWLLLHAAQAVGTGGFTLGEIHCADGDVLYCALEDNPRRIKSRMAKMFGPDVKASPRVRVLCEFPKLVEGGLEKIREWIGSVQDPRLIVIDRLSMVRVSMKRNDTQFQADYDAVKDLRTLAGEHHVAVVLVHHLRKAEADDPFDTVNATLGLTAAVDSILIIKREASGNFTLHGRGRDLTGLERAIAFSTHNCTWSILGEAGDVSRSADRAAIVSALEESGEEMTLSAITAATGIKGVKLRLLLSRMAKDNEIRKAARGRYRAKEAIA